MANQIVDVLLPDGSRARGILLPPEAPEVRSEFPPDPGPESAAAAALQTVDLEIETLIERASEEVGLALVVYVRRYPGHNPDWVLKKAQSELRARVLSPLEDAVAQVMGEALDRIVTPDR